MGNEVKETKVCKQCGEEKPLSAFSYNKYSSDGRMYRCRLCRNLNARTWRAQHPGYHQAMSAEWDRNHRSYRYDYLAEWHQKNPLIMVAHRAVKRALTKGELVRPQRCESCGIECKPDSHHEDYTKVLEVNWLCRSCHERRHNPLDGRPKYMIDEVRA